MHHQDLGHWITTLAIPTDPFGFIYLITNCQNFRKYVGKKQMTFKTCKKPLKGRVNKRRGEKESDWKTYTGSSKELNQDIQAIGVGKFRFEILKFCDSKWDLAYGEACEIITRGALTDKNFYNGWLNCKIPAKKQK